MKESFIFQLSTLGQNILLALAVLSAIFLAVLSIRNAKEKLDTYLLRSVGSFLVLYFPIFYLWIFGNGAIWPIGFVPGPENYSLELIANHKFWNSLYFILLSLSTSFLIYSIIVLVNLTQAVADTTTSWDKIRLKIPLINIAFLGIELRRLFYPSTFLKFLVAPWMMLAAFWVYFKFLANPLVEFGIDSYSFLDRFFFQENFQARVNKTGSRLAELEISPIGYDYASIFVMNNMVVAMVTFLAGISTIGLAIGIQKFGEINEAD